jgi:hypothetical protein
MTLIKLDAEDFELEYQCPRCDESQLVSIHSSLPPACWEDHDDQDEDEIIDMEFVGAWLEIAKR